MLESNQGLGLLLDKVPCAKCVRQLPLTEGTCWWELCNLPCKEILNGSVHRKSILTLTGNIASIASDQCFLFSFFSQAV